MQVIILSDTFEQFATPLLQQLGLEALAIPRNRRDRQPSIAAFVGHRTVVRVECAVDPDRDRPNLKEYVTQFHPDFIGLTGALDQIENALKGIDAVAVRLKPDARGNYQVNHTAAVAVIDPQARLVAKINPPFEPAPTAQFLADLIRRYGNARAPEGGR